MAPTLYMSIVSPPCRSVLLTAGSLDIDLNFKEVDLAKREHLSSDFVEINPQHTIPTLDDGGDIIWDSHAINGYLVAKYGQDDSLYPTDPFQRAVVDQRMHFDTGIAFNCIRSIVKTVWFGGEKEIREEQIKDANDCYGFLEKFLDDHDWVAGDSITIADFGLLATITSLNALVPIDGDEYPKVVEWIKRGEELPYYSANKEGLDIFENFMKMILSL